MGSGQDKINLTLFARLFKGPQAPLPGKNQFNLFRAVKKSKLENIYHFTGGALHQSLQSKVYIILELLIGLAHALHAEIAVATPCL